MFDKEQAKEEIAKLIGRYEKYKEDKELMHNERQACDSLIRPFFRDVLGWDIDNPYEFKSEYVQGGKRVDYIACINGVTQFIIEAKAPSRDIKEKSDFYKQAIQYAEAKDKDFAILTNFKTFIILRAGIETDNIFKNEILTIDIQNLKDRDIDFINYFEKEFWVKEGENSPLYSVKNLRKKKKIDEVLVEHMTKWREYLLRSLKGLNKGEYNFEDEKEFLAIEEEIQKYIDRLIFICFCEDKQIEDNELKPLLNVKQSKYFGKPFLVTALRQLFKKYHNRYNSDLFKEGLCDSFEFHDPTIQEILEDLRVPLNTLPYDFSIIDADILGRAYESFLGHITTGEKRFKEKEDIGKRKKHGIYYTPSYIVNYIVLNTVREKVKNLPFEEICKIKILDPACGSGSFLIKAYDILLEESKIALKRDLIYNEKKSLLLNCIYGVDLDERACDIAKLNLSLKIATRGEKIPELHHNIQNGNSLIDESAVAGDKAFNWEFSFSDAFRDGGFDVVIGNPPYIFARSNKFNEEEKKYYYDKYKLQGYQLNTYGLFVEKVYYLLKKKGSLGFIIPNNWLTINTFRDFRNFIIDGSSKNQIINIYDKVFSEANVDTCVLVFNKDKPDNVSLFEMIDSKIEEIGSFPYSDFKDKIINISSLKNKESGNNLNKIESNSVKLGEISKVSTGLKAYQMGKGKPKQTEDMKIKRIFHSNKRLNKDFYPYLEGKDVGRYILSWSGEYLKYGDFLAEPRKSVPFKGERILVRQIPSKLPYCINAVFTNEEVLHDINSMVIFNSKPEYSLKLILGIINSKLISYWFANKFGKLQRGLFPQFKVGELAIFPIKYNINTKDIKEIVDLVDQMLSLQKKLHESKISGGEKERLEQQIKNIDYEIDQEVYKLYGITPEEQKVIEESLK